MRRPDRDARSARRNRHPSSLRSATEMAHRATPTPIRVGGSSIRRDPDGRYSLDDIYRAIRGGLGQTPQDWLSRQETLAFLAQTELPVEPGQRKQAPVRARGEGRYAYAVLPVAHAYARELSPEFAAALIQGEERKAPVRSKSEPEFMTIEDAGRALGIRTMDLLQHMESLRWIYRSTWEPGTPWAAESDAESRGLLTTQSRTVRLDNGQNKRVQQLRVTPKGLEELRRTLGAA